MVEGHRSQAPSQGGQTMMGDSGREHVRCSKADWGEKRERRVTPSPKPKTGTRRGSVRAEKWCRCQCHPQPHALHSALPGRHSSPLAPTQAHLLRGPWGRKAVHKQGPPRECRPLGEELLPAQGPRAGEGSGVHSALCPSISKAGARALREPESFQESRQTAWLPVSMPQCSAEHKDTSHLPGSGGAAEERVGTEGRAGTHRR